MKDVSFKNIIFNAYNGVNLDSSWNFYASSVSIDSIKFSNITLSFTSQFQINNKNSFLDIKSNMATLNNITLENSNLNQS